MDLRDKRTDINKLRAEIGFVFQQFNLYPHLTVLKNITLAPDQDPEDPAEGGEAQAMALLERVGLRRSGTPTRPSSRAGSSSGSPSRAGWP
jgi:polar amino acid transport system ATP-binding protein